MNISRRSILGMGGGLAAAATLVACGQNNPMASPTGAASPATSETGMATGEKVDLTQWYHEYGEAGVKEAVERFAAEYEAANVTVKWTPGDYNSILAAQLLTAEVPDVFEAEQGGSLDQIRSGQLEDLTELIGDAKDQFNKSVMKRFTFEDKIHGIPQTIDMQLLYYRPSLLKAAGVEVPTTFEELVAAANAVKTSSTGGFFAGNDGGIGVLGTLFIWASGYEQLNDDRTEAAFLNDDFYKALVAYRDFSKSGGVVQSASAEWYSPDAFVNEEAAFQWGGLWSLPDITKAFGDDVGVMAFPAMGAKGRPAVPFGAFGACVAAKGKNVEAAKDFVKWLWIDQEDKQVEFSDAYGTHIPAKDALVSKATKLSSGPGSEAAKFVADSGFANDIMWSGAIGDKFNAAVSNVIKNGADPAAEFEPLKDLIKSELEKLKG
ncbi:ABC transporter substrate-binding protein [Tessaracoccus antarcticus]|uniref:Extracellular solute-binding protein n=1 Tax=Tessaracoccus antarcticus TaxID=2479848 RepID=A0A3M0GBI8_9ACTN|nr:extracellular solute-binding protein [Tessaracoccus antarcticus]RMB59932.1 extracellular solute-binding protein [Tessaracoccus antarcticus]